MGSEDTFGHLGAPDPSLLPESEVGAGFFPHPPHPAEGFMLGMDP